MGREVLAQLSTPAALNFSAATDNDRLDRNQLITTGTTYIEILHDLDTLVGQSDAFKLSSWLSSARKLASRDSAGNVQQDCFSPILTNKTGYKDGCCMSFFEWNARCQITTWYVKSHSSAVLLGLFLFCLLSTLPSSTPSWIHRNPTPPGAARIPGGPIDYASKHWHGLIVPYYTKRSEILLHRALQDEVQLQPLNNTELQRLFAVHAFEWTTSFSFTTSESPVIIENAREISHRMIQKYSHWFSSCDSLETTRDIVDTNSYTSLSK
jgi:Alpha-N-acetylglucosaminidase (NAGLU) C-terminal domain